MRNRFLSKPVANGNKKLPVLRTAIIFITILTVSMLTPMMKPVHVSAQQNFADPANELNDLKAQSQSFQDEVNGFRGAEDRWNKRNRRFAISAAISAAVLAVGFAIASWLASVAAADLSHKGQQSSDAKEKVDVRIRSLLDLQANKDISEARAEAAKAKEGAEDAKRGTAVAQADAARAGERAAELAKDTEQLRQANLNTEKSLEDEKSKRVELAVGLLPRRVFNQTGAAKLLENLKPRKVVFEYLDEEEPRKCAMQLAFVFQSLGWTIEAVPSEGDFIGEGVSIQAGAVHRPTTGDDGRLLRDSEVISETTDAARAIMQALSNTSDIEFTYTTAQRGFLQTLASELFVTVGSKPNRALQKTLEEFGPKEDPTVYRGYTSSGSMTGIPMRRYYPVPNTK